MLGKITYNRQGEIIGKVLIKTNILQYTLVAINVAKKLHKLWLKKITYIENLFKIYYSYYLCIHRLKLRWTVKLEFMIEEWHCKFMNYIKIYYIKVYTYLCSLFCQGPGLWRWNSTRQSMSPPLNFLVQPPGENMFGSASRWEYV